eukprot:TRINITY_DN100987_c0_g1_i1.p2 TRINITY_DN100987_c0_g1~~TRINITY_DN100987_c0_g1_i1.p2  ORF type:complete len:103 (+),score=4.89 TRINITY_DN100987_c0_g1_i1:94-402(+)
MESYFLASQQSAAMAFYCFLFQAAEYQDSSGRLASAENDHSERLSCRSNSKERERRKKKQIVSPSCTDTPAWSVNLSIAPNLSALLRLDRSFDPFSSSHRSE